MGGPLAFVASSVGAAPDHGTGRGTGAGQVALLVKKTDESLGKMAQLRPGVKF